MISEGSQEKTLPEKWQNAPDIRTLRTENIQSISKQEQITLLVLRLYYFCDKNSNQAKTILKHIFSLEIIRFLQQNQQTLKPQPQEWANDINTLYTILSEETNTGIKQAADIIVNRFTELDKRIKTDTLNEIEYTEWEWFLNFGLPDKSQHRTRQGSFFQHGINEEWARFAKIMSFIATHTTDTPSFHNIIDSSNTLHLTHQANNHRKQYERTRIVLTACLKKNLREIYVTLLKKLPFCRIDQALSNNNDELKRYLALDDSLGLFTLLYAIKAYTARHNIQNLHEKLRELIQRPSSETLKNLLNSNNIPHQIRSLFPYLGQAEIELENFYWESGVSLFLQQQTGQEILTYTSYADFSALFLLSNVESKIKQTDPRILAQFAIKHHDHTGSYPNPIIFKQLETKFRLQFIQKHLAYLTGLLTRLTSDEENREHANKVLLKKTFKDFGSTYLSWVFLIYIQLSLNQNSVIPLFTGKNFDMERIQNAIRAPLMNGKSAKDKKIFMNIELLNYAGEYWKAQLQGDQNIPLYDRLNTSLCQIQITQSTEHALYQQIVPQKREVKTNTTKSPIESIQPTLPVGTMYNINNHQNSNPEIKDTCDI